MFADRDPANHPDFNPFQAVENNISNSKIGFNSTYLKSCSGFLKIFALVRNLMIHSFEIFLLKPRSSTFFSLYRSIKVEIVSEESSLEIGCVLIIQQKFRKFELFYCALLDDKNDTYPSS